MSDAAPYPPNGAHRRGRQPVRLPPRPISKPTRYLAVTAIVRNEGRYLREWIEFQRLMGAEQVYLYDNGSTDDTTTVLGPFVAEGFVTVIPWAEFDDDAMPQRQAYAHALCNFGPEFRWMAIIDLDEFLFPVKALTLVEALSDYEDCPCVCVPWFLFGFSGHDSPPEDLTIAAYTRRALFPPPQGIKTGMWKSIVHPAAVAAVDTPHMFVLTNGHIGGMDEKRQAVAKGIVSVPPPGAVLRINHYITRSRQEFGQKTMSKRFNVRPMRKLHTLVDMIEAQAVDDDTILQFLPALREKLEIGKGKASRPDPNP